MTTADDINRMLATHWPSCPFTCLELAERHAIATVEVREEDLRPGGYVCGPALFAAADAALWFLASAGRETPQAMALTSDLAIRYLSPAVGQRIIARADLNKSGGRTMIGSVSVWMDDSESEPCAIAQGAYILPA
ncbi:MULTISPECIES: PaaI family thioesterase [Halomonas]|uniref:PaaI family thioesterase n=1 Tax=Halomonas TaxID=2745 RepID=UPI001A8FAF53|nr:MULTISPECIES: PaaI family thioesterase [Halomonas]MBN8413159.1 PaaI family thioesterase [Halomonas litopenaei]MBY5924270.1 PaaI family thioesterase [Halomonas sp. DP4Y7-2]MBY5928434.1 PaaI family thioesterase [Halomonas sp. DP8Y7-3]MBY5967033.1 PaaI family thioesterase [Halomonas denitrificans]MBY5982531.1 PaaI family thioesterase [Halomonas sp. DP5Y7-2]